MEQAKKLITQIDFDIAVLVSLGVMAIIVAVYDLFGGSGISSPVLVGVLGLLLLESVLQRARQRKATDAVIETIKGIPLDSKHNETLREFKDLRSIIQSLGGIEVQLFDDVSACLRYVNRRLLEAKKQVDDLSWDPIVSGTDHLETAEIEARNYWQLTAETAERLRYREVFIFNREGRTEKFSRRVTEKPGGYWCGYYKPTNVPLLQFMLIDEEEAIFLTGEHSLLAIRNASVVKLLVDYYELIWSKSIKLMEAGRVCDANRVERILNQANY